MPVRRGAHRMTPARRAALRKAQSASARKRRRKKQAVSAAKYVGKGAASLGGAFISIQATRYMSNPRALGKDYKDAKNSIKGMKTRRANKKFAKRKSAFKAGRMVVL